MAYVDERAGEIRVQIVYHGPCLSGRTSNLRYVHHRTRPEARGRCEAVAAEAVRDMSGQAVTIATVLCCEIVPQSVAPIQGRRLRLCLFTAPGALYVEGNEERLLRCADGVVFVADSQPLRGDACVASMEALAAAVARQGRTLASVPLALQYNKRDLPEVVPVAELDAALNRDRRPSFEAVAPTGHGVFETLKAVVRPIVAGLRA